MYIFFHCSLVKSIKEDGAITPYYLLLNGTNADCISERGKK